jgi:hypothetical protein
MTEEDLKVVEAMSRYGGSFVQALAEAARRADMINLEIIKKSWPAYWSCYTRMAKEIAEKENHEAENLKQT